MKNKISKTLIVLFILFLGGGIFFFFGMNYFLSEIMGIPSIGLGDVANNLPEEISFLKWIILGMVVLAFLPMLMPFIFFGVIGKILFKAKWKSLKKDKDLENKNENPFQL